MSDDQFEQDADDFLMSGGTPSAKFPTVGTSVTGVIDRKPEVQQQRDFDSGEPLTWDDGSPRKQLKVVLQTDERDPDIEDDEGYRALYVKAALKNAIQQAVRKSGAKGLKVGGRLTVVYAKDGEAKRRGMNAPKLYSAEYVPPPDAADEVLNTPEPEPQQAPPAAAPQAPDLSSMSPEQIAALLQAAQAQTANA